jgi:hypothetical protein
MINIHEISDVLKPWTPILSVATVAFTLYRSAKKKVAVWANTLLHNHMTHMQASLERIESTQTEQVDQLSVQTENLQSQTQLLSQIADSLQKPAPRKTVKIKQR